MLLHPLLWEWKALKILRQMSSISFLEGAGPFLISKTASPSISDTSYSSPTVFTIDSISPLMAIELWLSSVVVINSVNPLISGINIVALVQAWWE
jgi:hypothetical protein